MFTILVRTLQLWFEQYKIIEKQDQDTVVYILCNEVISKSFCGSGGIRTHASEETGALNQRLRPLGHATVD